MNEEEEDDKGGGGGGNVGNSATGGDVGNGVSTDTDDCDNDGGELC